MLWFLNYMGWCGVECVLVEGFVVVKFLVGLWLCVVDCVEFGDGI